MKLLWSDRRRERRGRRPSLERLERRDLLSGIGDAGFEQPSLGNGSFTYGVTGTPWGFTRAAGVSGNGSGFTGGNPAAPEGTQVAFIQGQGVISQPVTDWAAGTYVLRFDAAQRANYQSSRQDFRVLVDNSPVGTFTPVGTDYAVYDTTAFTVAAGNHAIVFQGINSAGGDNTAFLDDVRIVPTSPAPPALSDAGFEDPSVGPGGFRYGPTGTLWAFTSAAGVSGNGSGFTGGNPAAPEGAQVGFLQGDGAMTQSVNVSSQGTYRLGFLAAQRANYQQSYHDFRILVDGQEVGSFRPAGTSYQALGVTLSLSAGAHTIRFAGINSAGGDNTSFIDAVSLTPA